MKLDEIIQRPQQSERGFSFSDFDISNARFVGTAENFPIYHLHSIRSEQEMYALKENKNSNEFISMIIGTSGKWLNNKSAFFIQRTYTTNQFRNRGLMTSLYYALYIKLKMILVSDFEQSPETVSIWKKIALSLPVKVLDTRNPQDIKLHNYKEFPQTEILGDENIRLVLEEISTPKELDWLYKSLDKYHDYDPNNIILEDYHVYTHHDNLGKYE